jgi:hypothetical protein
MFRARVRLARRVQVQIWLDGQRCSHHDVHVFELIDHPRARYCYAWEGDGRVVMVLGLPPVRSAMDAVQSTYAKPVLRRRMKAVSTPAHAWPSPRALQG